MTNINKSNIDSLLERFFEGETSRAEERALEEFFAGKDVPEHLEVYRPMFAWYSAGMPEESKADRPKRARLLSSPRLWWVSGAAAVAVVAAIGWNHFRVSSNAELLAACHEGSYVEINGVVYTDINDIYSNIKAINLEAEALELELQATSLELEAESIELSATQPSTI